MCNKFIVTNQQAIGSPKKPSNYEGFIILDTNCATL